MTDGPPDLSRPATEVAPQLLGCLFTAGSVTVRLTEVEAYEGEDDPASHAWRGPTPRTRVMFGPAGTLYVYLSYGIHHAMNIVCGADGTASAVLLRSGEVVHGLPLAQERRGRTGPAATLGSGPGRLTQALGVDLSHNGMPVVSDATSHQPPVAVLTPRAAAPDWTAGPRVGVSRAADRPLRFWVTGDASVSGYRRGGRRPGRSTGGAA